MKKTYTIMIFAFIMSSTFAQNAGQYMESMTKEFGDITADMWDYTSAVAHGKSARKVENRRKDVLKSNMDAQRKIERMGAFEGDKTFRDSVLSFLRLSYNVINYDYGKIVDMEAVAEESYDAMEAYLLAQERANIKLNAASDMINAKQAEFANTHGITLVDKKDKTAQKLEIAGKVFKYYNGVYLIFFKPYKQEAYMIDALNKNDVNALKQNADALAKISAESLARLDTLQAFKGDNTLKIACKELCEFYKAEATTKAQVLINFSLKKESFDKIKASFDAKPEKSRSKNDVDEYNKAITDLNKASNEFNTVNNDLNTKRTAALTKWNNAVASFTDRQTPKYK